MSFSRIDIHNHTRYSNIRLIDAMPTPEALIDYAIQIGLKGIAITDHEALSAHPKAVKYAEKIKKDNPDFKVILGDEIYLVDERPSDSHYHFILLAKDKIGHKQLRILSSKAWLNSYHARGLERVDTLKVDLERIVKENPGHLIASTACIGGELGKNILNLTIAEKGNNQSAMKEYHDNIVKFLMWCKNLFKDDFYLEVQPGISKEQIIVNRRMVSIAAAFNIPMIISSDTHYLKKEDRWVHKAYLNSKEGEREVDAFYQDAYLHSEEEIFEKLKLSDYNEEFIKRLFENSMSIYNKIEDYTLFHKQTIPKVDVKDYPKAYSVGLEDYPILTEMHQSDNKVERYWINECLDKLDELGKFNPTYLSRLEEEADIKRTIGKALDTNMFAYPVTLQHYCDLFWECGSIVGAGRGSSCSGLNHYLLGVTQLDPIEWSLPFWRYLNKARTELGDIDIDLCPSKRPLILNKIKEERKLNFIDSLDNESKNNLGCTLIATFGTEGTKSAVLTACRGYRSEEYPDGIDVDTAQYLSSLIPSERGFLWPLDDVVNGNKDKDRKPIPSFINEVNNYPGLLNIMLGIEGTINKRSSHASGVILFDEDPYEFGCFMKTPKGEVITQYDLHDAEWCGMTKYDFLVTEVQDKIAECIKLLQEDEQIESYLSLREAYDKYFHPEIIDLDDLNCWKALRENTVLDVFQFNSDVGSQAAKKIKPQSILEMSDANGLMRLMTSEKGEETPMEKYIKFKENISLWYKEMDRYGLTKEEQKIVEPHFKSSYGVPPSQEQLMRMLMDENICHFTLAEANAARKIVGKKQMSKIPELKEKVLSQASSPALGKYIWDCGVGPQMGYSFSCIHALAYSFIGYQTLYLATHWNPIYWNTACLVVNSGSLEDNSEEELVSIYADEHQDLAEGVTFVDLPDRSGKIKKTSSTDYGKTAKALGDIISKGIKVSLVDINRSGYSFKPDAANNEILFGMKGLNRVSEAVIEQIIAGRPYKSIIDFMNRCPLNKTVMISLIKSGAFDKLDSHWGKDINIEPRLGIMAYYISQISEPKKKLTLQNFSGLLQKNLIPASMNKQKNIFEFNKFLKAYRKHGQYYTLNESCLNFYNTFFEQEYLEVINGTVCIKQNVWDKLYKKQMETMRTWLADNQDEVLKEFNDILFKETWNKYATGSISAWEMESLCFYYHNHELSKVDNNRYGIANFNNLSSKPVVESVYKRGGKEILIYKTYKIIGTVISKNDTKSSVSLLTVNSGVVNVKFTKEQYAFYNRQLSQKQEDGKKKVVEKGWFARGVKLMITGIRRDDMFVAKTYKNTQTHQIYRIDNISNNGQMELTHDRAEV